MIGQLAESMRRIQRTLSPTCRDAARLISQSLDDPLPWNVRLPLGIHLVLCGLCRRYQRQLHFMQHSMRDLTDHLDRIATPSGLSEPARERVKQSLQRLKAENS